MKIVPPLNYDDFKILIKRGYTITESCEKMGVSRSFYYQNSTRQQLTEIKKIKKLCF